MLFVFLSKFSLKDLFPNCSGAMSSLEYNFFKTLFWELGTVSRKPQKLFALRKAIFSSSVFKNGEVYTPESSSIKGTSVHIKNACIKQLCNRKVRRRDLLWLYGPFPALSRNEPLVWFQDSYAFLAVQGFDFSKTKGFNVIFSLFCIFKPMQPNLSKAFCTHLKGLRGDNDTDTILKIITQIF